MKKQILILGAGISGLAVAFWLEKRGYQVTVLEKKKHPGGCVQSEKLHQVWLEWGPNSILNTNPQITSLICELGLKDEMIFASDKSQKRYILKNEQLHALPTGLIQFLKTPLFSFESKLKFLKEPWIKPTLELESVAQFVRRRLGEDFLNYAINPFVSGVYAGDPKKLCLKYAFPKLYQLELEYSSLIRGLLFGVRKRNKRKDISKNKAKLLTMKHGNLSIINQLATQLKDFIYYDTSDIQMNPNNRYEVQFKNNQEIIHRKYDAIISTVPAYEAVNIFNWDPELLDVLKQIEYPPVMVMALAYSRNQIQRLLDGFGFLIPEVEKKSFLGCIWNSSIFPEKYPGDDVIFSIFIGGTRQKDLFNKNTLEEIQIQVIDELSQLLTIQGPPKWIEYRFWEKSIPQYDMSYPEKIEKIESFEKKYPFITLSGNYRNGISFGDCILNAFQIAQHLNL